MKENSLSRRSFVKVSTASIAALSLPSLMSNAAEAPAGMAPGAGTTANGAAGLALAGEAAEPRPAPQAAQQGAQTAPAPRPGDSDAITRAFFDSLLVETRYMDADLPSTKLELFGETFDTPIMTAALSHLRVPNGNGLAVYAEGAAKCHAVHWMGMGEDKDLEEVIATGARTIKIIKPHADNAEVFRRIRHAVGAGCFAVGMDIDHAFNGRGGYDNVFGLPMKPKTTQEMKSFVQAAGIPFIVKGVLSPSDARRCLEAGVAGIVLSHHGGRVAYSIPPLMALEQIAEAVGGKMKIFIDCGIVSGMDAYKCLALGADAVSVGRHLMPLVQEGSDAVAKRIQAMTAELAGVMSATGVRDLKKMDPTVIHRMF